MKRGLAIVSVFVLVLMMGMMALSGVNGAAIIPLSTGIVPRRTLVFLPTATPKKIKIFGTLRVPILTLAPTDTPMPPTFTPPPPTQTAVVVTATSQAKTPVATRRPAPVQSPVAQSCPSPAIAYQQAIDSNTVHIFSYSLTSGKPTDITPGLTGKASHPRISPDGQNVVFELETDQNGTSQTGVYVVAACGGIPQAIADDPKVNEQQPIWVSATTMVLSVQGNDLFLVDLAASTATDLGVACSSPEASPKGEFVACIDDNSMIEVVSTLGRANGFFVLPIKGSNPRWLADATGITFSKPVIGEQLISFVTGQVSTLDATITDVTFDPANTGRLAIVVQGQILLTNLQNLANRQSITNIQAIAGSPDWSQLGVNFAANTQTAKTFLSQYSQQ